MGIGAAITGTGSQMTIIAVGFDIYDRTASTFAVSLVGVFALAPMIIFGLYGGAFSDRFDRRRVALIAACVAWGSTAAIAIDSWMGVPDPVPLSVFVAFSSVVAIMVKFAPQTRVPAGCASSGDRKPVRWGT